MKPVEIYMADLGAATPHPVIVVSREELNHGDRAVVGPEQSENFIAGDKIGFLV